MAISVFSDKDRKPSARQISQVLGAKKPIWDRLLQFIASNYQIPPDLSFGGKNYGWNLWYRKGGNSLVSLYPQDGYLVAQIVLGRAQAEEASALKLGINARRAIEEAPQFHDGRWLFIRTRTERDAKDVESLLQIKKRPRPSPGK